MTTRWSSDPLKQIEILERRIRLLEEANESLKHHAYAGHEREEKLRALLRKIHEEAGDALGIEPGY